MSAAAAGLNDYIFADAEQLRSCADTEEFAYYQSAVANQNYAYGKDCPADAEPLANEIE